MGISLQQVMRQTQRLIMTPQMQQSIQLLQMNALELEQLTQEELLENPFLQLEEDRADGAEEQQSPTEDREAAPAEPEPGAKDEEFGGSLADDAPKEDFLTPVEKEVATLEAPLEPGAEALQSADQAPAETETKTIEEAPEQFENVDVNWEEFFEGAENRTYTREPSEEKTDFSEYTAARVSLYDYLMNQLRLCVLEGVDAEIGEYFVGCIDENGFLPPEAVAEAAEKFDRPLTDVEDVLEVLQEFDPPGVAARSSSECLIIQMHALGQYCKTVRIVLEDHFGELQRRKFKEIAKALDVDEREILKIYHQVSRLEPKPGRCHSKESPQYITADVYVKSIDGELSIFLNEGSNGHLSISRLYRRLMRLQQKALTPEEKSYATEKFRGALMLIKNIEKRKSTILRVTEAIMDVQAGFLNKGVSALKPLTLREIADMVGMHESTIARVTAAKYVETPQGLYPLKFFFSSSISSTNGMGEAVSSRAIKDKLLALIDLEDTKKPLSDQKIAEILKHQGFSIARRTVAKYRDQLKILPAKLRRDT